MAGERILYVCFDPALLVARERLLMESGYQVYTVLGTDGLMALRPADDVDFILVGDEGPLAERQKAVRWLKEELLDATTIALYRGHDYIAGADYQVSAADAEAWLDEMADCIRESQHST